MAARPTTGPPVITPGRDVLKARTVVDITIAIAHCRARHPVPSVIVWIVPALGVIPGARIVAVDARLAPHPRLRRIYAKTFGIAAVRRDRRRLGAQQQGACPKTQEDGDAHGRSPAAHEAHKVAIRSTRNR